MLSEYRSPLSCRGCPVASVSHFMQDAETALRLEAQFLQWKTASRVLRILPRLGAEPMIRFALT